MKIEKIETLRCREPMPLPGPYTVAWYSADNYTVTEYAYSIVKITTDDGLVGYGPNACVDAYVREALIGKDPRDIERFWYGCMSGKDVPMGRGSYGGIDAALWDLCGKAAGMPVRKLLGSFRDKMPVYAATSRLLTPEEHADQCAALMEMGFRAIKLRLHRMDPREDIKAVRAVRERCGSKLTILVDANQNNRSRAYRWWDFETARRMMAQLQELGVYYIEEPLPRDDYAGLARLSREFDLLIAGGEHSTSIYEFRPHILADTYDIIQPDMVIGDVGISGIRRLGVVSEYMKKRFVPHVCSLSANPLELAASLQACASLMNCPFVEYPFDPPFLTVETQQMYLRNKLFIDPDGTIDLGDRPGLGVEVDESWFA